MAADFYVEMQRLGQRERLLNLYRCMDKGTKRKVWFRPNKEQLKYYDNQSTRDLILKPRQIGFTQLTVVIGVDNCIFKEGAQEGLMAHKKERAVELFQRVRDTIDWCISDWEGLLSIEFNRDSAKKIIFDRVNGKEMKTSYEVALDFRSASVNRLHISEASRVSVEVAQGSIDSVPPQGQIIMETTANGRDAVFYNKYKATRIAEKKDDVRVWKPHFFPWFEHYPEEGHNIYVPKEMRLDEKEFLLKSIGISDECIAWRRWKIEENFKDEPDKFDEEYPTDDETCFLGGSSVVPRKILLLLERSITKPIIVGGIHSEGKWLKVVESEQGYLSLWERPRYSESYVIGADPSEGVGKDAAAAWVKNRRNGAYVARIHSKFLPPDEFSNALFLLARYFNNADICFELNNHGFVLKDRLVNTHKYLRLYHRRDVSDLYDSFSDAIGFRTTKQEKERIVSQFVSRIKEGKVKVFCEDFLTEATNFQRNENGKLEAVSGCNDDLFMAACFTEEMDSSLGELMDAESYEPPVMLNPITGFPIDG